MNLAVTCLAGPGLPVGENGAIDAPQSLEVSNFLKLPRAVVLMSKVRALAGLKTRQ